MKDDRQGRSGDSTAASWSNDIKLTSSRKQRVESSGLVALRDRVWSVLRHELSINARSNRGSGCMPVTWSSRRLFINLVQSTPRPVFVDDHRKDGERWMVPSPMSSMRRCRRMLDVERTEVMISRNVRWSWMWWMMWEGSERRWSEVERLVDFSSCARSSSLFSFSAIVILGGLREHGARRSRGAGNLLLPVWSRMKK